MQQPDASSEVKMQQFLAFYQARTLYRTPCQCFCCAAVLPFVVAVNYGAALCVTSKSPISIGLSSNRSDIPSVLKILQRELAMYVYHNLDRPLTSYFLDKDIHPVFKGAHGSACIIESST